MKNLIINAAFTITLIACIGAVGYVLLTLYSAIGAL